MPTANIPTASQQIPVAKIVPSPFQARKAFDETALKDLAQTMSDHGLENPVLVRPVAAGYELIAGERRWRAAKLLGWETMEAKVEAVDDREAALRGMIENVQREDLSPIEEAAGLRTLTQAPFNLNQAQIAKMVGKDRTVVSKYLSVAVLADSEASVHRCTSLGLRHLVELVRLTEPADRLALADEAVSNDLAVHELKALVDKKLGKKGTTPSPGLRPPLPAGRQALPSRGGATRPDLQWNGEEILINRSFRPKDETKEEYCAWLSRALEPMLSGMPGLKQGSGVSYENHEPVVIGTPEEQADLAAKLNKAQAEADAKNQAAFEAAQKEIAENS